MRQFALYPVASVILPVGQGAAYLAFFWIYFGITPATDEASLITAAIPAGLICGLLPAYLAAHILRAKSALSGDDVLFSMLLGQFVAWMEALLIGWVGWVLPLSAAIVCAIGPLVGAVLGVSLTRPEFEEAESP